MRSLIYVPILHGEADLGGVAQEVRERFVEMFGADAWARKAELVSAMWDGLGTRLSALPLDWRRTRLYQDGLPVCDAVERIVRDLAAAGSRNHRLLIDLQARGATLMGTEDPELLVREYRRIRGLIEMARLRGPGAVMEEGNEGEALLQERDRFVARRVEETLGPGETGLLFMGLLHRTDELLDGRFEVWHVIHALPFGADSWRRLRKG
ncbi:MAG: hypothetical protein QME96_18295 [Myxococcota bacterium]|nr:hypothetical protein [Myxococcota bacterium]